MFSLKNASFDLYFEKNIHISEYIQSDEAAKLAFSTSAYWGSITDFDYIYNDDNDSLRNVVEGYETYLKSKLSKYMLGYMFLYN